MNFRIAEGGGARRDAHWVTILKVKVRDLVRILESNGWRLKTTRGSHRQFRHPQKGMVVTVAGQLGKDLPAGTLRAILRSAGIDAKEAR
jgi:predicted RNA binding protein YcfA (HicA-like mRNA interferase family)